jgi:hypothetical protein
MRRAQVDHDSFFRFQRRALGVLLGWGLGSALVGLALSLRGDEAQRQFGLQALSWGLIDAALAAFGMRGASSKLARPGSVDVIGEARRFRTILALNGGLDIGYVATGAHFAYRGRSAARRGMGWGILVQGLFLLLFDTLLALKVQAELPGRRKI